MRSPLFVASLFALNLSAVADDGVKPKGSTITYRGEIVRNDQSGGTLKWGRGGQLKEFAHDQFDRIDTNWPDGFESGKAALSKGQFPQAATSLRSALREEKRPWAQDLCRGLLLRALDGQGDVDGAAEVFVELAPSRSDTAF